MLGQLLTVRYVSYLLAALLAVTTALKLHLLLTDPFADIKAGTSLPLLWLAVLVEFAAAWLAIVSRACRSLNQSPTTSNAVFKHISITTASLLIWAGAESAYAQTLSRPRHSEPAANRSGLQDDEREPLVHRLAQALGETHEDSAVHLYFMGLSGSFDRIPTPHYGRMPERLFSINQLEWATQTKMGDEIELVAFQRQECSQLQKRVDELSDKWATQLLKEFKALGLDRGQTLTQLGETERAKLEAKLNEFENERLSIQAQFDKVLLPHQQRVLDKFCLRFELLRKGATVALEPLLEGELGLSTADRERVRDALKKRVPELNAAAITLISKQNEEILKLLNQDQREIFTEKVGSLDNLCLPVLELAALQLAELPEEATTYQDILDEWSSIPLSCGIRPTGELENASTRGLWDAAPNILLAIVASPPYRPMESWGDMSVTYARANLNEWLPHVEYPADELEKIRAAYQRGEITLQQTKDMFEERHDEYNRKRLEVSLDILSQSQKLQLETVLMRRILATKGLHRSLVDGLLGRKLGLSHDQISDIRELAKTHREEVIEKSQSLESKVWSWIADELSNEQAKLIQDQFVIALEHTPGAPFLLVGAFDK